MVSKSGLEQTIQQTVNFFRTENFFKGFDKSLLTRIISIDL